ncbi:MAG: hypothetical protein PVH25_09250 [Burkholderiales bacterium]|jgi:cytochrome c2
MKRLLPIITVSIVLGIAFNSRTIASDLSEGEELYTSQCKLCHGSLTQDTGLRVPNISPGRIELAMLETLKSSKSDFLTGLIPSPAAPAGERIAFAPPFGPNLRGVVGRPAGSVEGYTYSKTMMSTLKGMVWNEAALNVWITNPQAWVPGVYMFYKQPDPEIRRKIILYLKANP